MTTQYVYICSEKPGEFGDNAGLWTVGFYDARGAWQPESDHATAREAADRVHWLNGGAPKDPVRPAPTGLFDPRPVDTEHLLFEPIWQAIKGWDIQRRHGEGYAGATGTDVQVIIDAIEAKQ